jgi:tetratricopeptide (TPR) repeat protein
MPHAHRRLIALAVATLGLAWSGGVAQDLGDAPAERLWLDAQRLEQNGELGEALEQYAMVVEQFPASPQAPRALLSLALGRWSQDDAAGAFEATATLSESYAEFREAAAGLVLKGNIQRVSAVDKDALRDARATLGRAVAIYPPARYPALTARAQALIGSGEISLLLGEVDLAAAVFLAAVEDEGGQMGAAAGLGLSRVLLQQGDWASAAETLQAIVAKDAGPANGGTAHRRTARRRLSLIHRLLLRPQIGQRPWATARMLQVGQLQLRDPVGVAASLDGRLTIADEDGPLASLVGLDNLPVHQSRIDDIRPPWFDSNGTPYFLGRRYILLPPHRNVYRFSVPGNNESRPLEDLAAGGRGLFGQWYLLDTDPRRVLQFDAARTYQATLVEERQEPVDLAVDAWGRLHVLQEETNTIVRFDSEGTRQGAIVTGAWRRPYAVDVDELGHLYVLDRDENKVQVYGRQGQLMFDLGPSLPGGIQLRDPRDVAVDGAGRVFIADRGSDGIVVLE